MQFPQGMTPVPGKALLLHNSLNGLKQSGANWHDKAHSHLAKLGFKSSIIEPCFYWRWDGTKLSMVALYVDDFHIASDCKMILDSIVSAFKEEFDCKIQSTELYLGLRLRDNGPDILVSQEQSISELLEMLGLENCRPVSTPAIPNTKLLKATGEMTEEQKRFPYREAVGKLLWIARCSRPDIYYAVNQLCAHSICHDDTHIAAVKHCARYLSGARTHSLRFRGGGDSSAIVLRAYCDADFAGEPETNDKPLASMSGCVLYLDGIGPVYWSAKLQSTISRSTSEAEYRAVGETAVRVTAIRNLLEEIGFKQEGPHSDI